MAIVSNEPDADARISYLLAKQTGESLLFKGDDFSQTDIVSALA